MGTWSLLCDDKMLRSAHYYSSFTSRPVDGYSEYDREILKQTMLNHEATFRKQVYELHRLYRIQRDLMDEIQKKQLYSYSVSAEASQSNPYSSRIPSEYAQNFWQMPSLSVVNSSYYGPSISGTDNRWSPLDFLSMRAGVSPTKNGGSVKDYGLLESKCKKFSRRTFDLQLPANEYIDSEDGEGTEEEKIHEMPLGSRCYLNRHENEHKSGFTLSLGTSENPSFEANDRKLDSHMKNTCSSHYLADLNEPIQEICNKQAEASGSSNFLGPMAFHEEIQGHQMPMEPNVGNPIPQRDFFLDNLNGGDHRTSLNILHENEEKRRERPSFYEETGKGRNNTNPYNPFSCNEKLPMSSASLQAEIMKGHGLLQFRLSDRSKKETWFTEKATCNSEISKACPGLSIHNFSEQVAPPVPSLFSATPAGDTNITSSPSSSQRNPTNNATHCPIAIQALQCFNGSAALNSQNKSYSASPQGPGIARENWDLHSNLRSHMSSLLYQNGCNHEFQSKPNASCLQFSGFEKPKLQNGDSSPYAHNEVCGPAKLLKGLHSTYVKSAKDMNLNTCLPNELQDRCKLPGDLVVISGGVEVDVPSRIPWLKRKLACDGSSSIKGASRTLDLGFSGCIQPFTSQGPEMRKFESGTGIVEDTSLGFVQEDATRSKDAVIHKIKLGDCPSNNKILGFPLLHSANILTERSAFGSSSMLCEDQSETYGPKNDVKNCSRHVNAHIDLPFANLEKKRLFVENPVAVKWLEDSPSGTQHCINLNSTVSPWDEETQSSEISSKADLEDPTSSLSRAAVETTVGIDLEVPIIILEEDTPLLADSPITNPVVTPVQLVQGEMEHPQQTLARVAAEAIVNLSSAISSHSIEANCSSSSLRDSLLWFSEVVSLSAGDLKNPVSVSRGKAEGEGDELDDGDDSFETLTLKLSETIVDVESCYKPWEQENLKDELTGPTPLPTRPRRRQARRGRQRKDFQKDILPGLVSLSRHEVTEDLQMIGGLIRASGCSWPVGLARRNTVRSGWHCQARGRRRPRGSVAAFAVNLVCPPPRQPSNGEVELEGISLRGWGKTTRRCRRQRFRVGNFSAPLT